MNLFHIFNEALLSLTVNKLRSALTILGIVIGVAAVIAMLAIGKGAQDSISSSINSIGTNLLFVTPGNEAARNPRPLTLNDAKALADPLNAPSVERVAPALQGRGEATYSGESVNTTIVAVTPDYFPVRNLQVAEGEAINEAQVTSRAAVAVLGSGLAESLFGRSQNIAGEMIRIEGQPFRVIGVLESLGGSDFGSQDDQVLLPMTTAQSRFLRRATRDNVDIVYVQAKSAEAVPDAIEEIEATLNARHRNRPGEPDFSILAQQDFLDTAQTITGVLTIFLGGVGGISLLVGGIGIMNIMYVTVSERTREIGLRKAVGARKLDILMQFLTESAVLSVIGGLIGVALAWMIATLVGFIAARSDVPITPLIQLDSVLLATLFSAGVGLFFGFYPARRAASLQPVEALRYE